jgi:hypothetical protein
MDEGPGNSYLLEWGLLFDHGLRKAGWNGGHCGSKNNLIRLD